ncbi:MAG: ArsB/NhaD family transporter [Bacillota bacterium]
MLEHYQVITAVAVFLVTYALIVSEKIHRTVAAFTAAAFLVLIGVMNVRNAVEAIDFNTIGLLVGMMVIVGVTRKTGIFQYTAVKAAKLSRGKPFIIIAALALVTAVLSAFLDNVTTVLLIVPATFSIARRLELNPVPFLISEIVASNIGGAATLIGDPPNIMIGGATGLGFMDFLINLTPVLLVTYIITIFIIRLIFRRELSTRQELQERIMELDENQEIKDPELLRKCLIVLFLTVLGFFLHQYVHLESSVIALSGMSLLLLITREDVTDSINAVEWSVIFFFIGLFVTVGALDKVGVIEAVAGWSLEVTHGNMIASGMLTLWISAIASAFVDNIPFVATMIPLIQDMGRLGGIADLNFLWWALSLGACLGGNGTIIGASANVIVIAMAEKRGYSISFIGFMKVAFPLMLMSIVLSTVYLVLWFYFNRTVVLVSTLGLGIVLQIALSVFSKYRSMPDENKAASDGAIA